MFHTDSLQTKVHLEALCTVLQTRVHLEALRTVLPVTMTCLSPILSPLTKVGKLYSDCSSIVCLFVLSLLEKVQQGED